MLLILYLIWFVYDRQYKILDTPEWHFHKLPFKTGDLVLFKANNNYNSLKHGCYFGHIGIVVMDGDRVLLFEANNGPVYPFENKGIYVSCLFSRISRYPGRVYLKALNKPLDPAVAQSFGEFVDYCMTNMYYDPRVIQNGFKKFFGIKKCGLATDCGQITFLSLIRLGLLDTKEYDVNRLHHLQYVCDIDRLLNGYQYEPIVRILV
jgi:hypothetical protein